MDIIETSSSASKTLSAHAQVRATVAVGGLYVACMLLWKSNLGNDAVRTIEETANREAATTERTNLDNSGWTPITTDEHSTLVVRKVIV